MPDSRIDEEFPFARVSNVALVFAVGFAAMAVRRFATFHNETFDLAFYARLVWGLGRGDLYQPITNSGFWGLHASPILYVLALLGRVFAIVPMLLVIQAAAVAAAGIPLARIAARRIGHPAAADVTLVAYLLYPTIGSVATYEFHPSTLALFPLAVALESFDRRMIRRGAIALFVAALCREDAALVAGFTGLALAVRREHRAVGLAIFAAGTGWFLVYLLGIAPRFLPAQGGSLELHYGHLGSSPSAILRALFTHPIASLRPLLTPVRLLYGPRLLVPVAFLSLLAPRWLIPAIVPLAINFVSQFPTAVQIQSHYATLAVPFIFVSAAHGTARLASEAAGAVNRFVIAAGLAVAAGTLHMQHRAGVTPISRRWDIAAFSRDRRSNDLERLLENVPSRSSIIAPDYLLAHLAERPLIQRIPWTRSYDYVVLSLEFRARFNGSQDLWRSAEEILVRNTLDRGDYGVCLLEGDQILLRHRWSPRAFAHGRYIEFQPDDGMTPQHSEVGPSMSLAGWGIRAVASGSVITVFLVPREQWPADLGIEVGWGPMRVHGDRLDPSEIVSVLPFDGLFSPSFVHVGEVGRTTVTVPLRPEALLAQHVFFGARRIDGSRLDPSAPHWIELRGNSQ